MGDGIQFVRQFIVDPRITGAVWPSSRGLARRMTEWTNWDLVNVVVEYGPGTGVFTEEILSRKTPQARYIGIERNARFAAMLKRRFPGLLVCNDSVARVRQICDVQGVESADLIVCGLPWASFTGPEQDAFLEAMFTVLPIGGKFATFAYLQGLLLPSGRRFRETLSRTFASVQSGSTVWANVPPAFVYRCTR
jgi:phospholipid N-methyltransferase